MFKEIFLGHLPSHFRLNPAVKTFIFSEILFWSAWNFITPIFAVFAANEIAGGSVKAAALAYSIYLAVRVIFELLAGRMLAKTSDKQKFLFTIAGTLALSLAYFGFALSENIQAVYVFYALAGSAMGLAAPAKNSIFSMHLDKSRETLEWGIYDAAVFSGMAASALIGGLIVSAFGFKVLFIMASVVNILGVIPYLLYLSKHGFNLNYFEVKLPQAT